MEYVDYANLFFPDLAKELPKNIGINEYAIKLIEGKQQLYGLIYSLGLVELETLKAYIGTHPKTRFIKPFKSSIDASILFDKKLDGSFYLFINY